MFRRKLLASLGLLLLVLAAPAMAGRTEQFVRDLYQRYAYRAPTSAELRYWGPVVERMNPEQAETRLKHWFFVHAVYKTQLGRTVTIHEVERTVDLMDQGILDYRAVQYSVFHSPDYARAKREGRAGTLMVPLGQGGPS